MHASSQHAAAGARALPVRLRLRLLLLVLLLLNVTRAAGRRQALHVQLLRQVWRIGSGSAGAWLHVWL
jgi:hypothetical protein